MFQLQDVLARAQTVVVNCRDFMQSFQDGLWMAKAIFREKHKDRFQELHESLSYVFQVGLCKLRFGRDAYYQFRFANGFANPCEFLENDAALEGLAATLTRKRFH